MSRKSSINLDKLPEIFVSNKDMSSAAYAKLRPAFIRGT